LVRRSGVRLNVALPLGKLSLRIDFCQIHRRNHISRIERSERTADSFQKLVNSLGGKAQLMVPMPNQKSLQCSTQQLISLVPNPPNRIIHAIQALLGHASVESTARYAQVTRRYLHRVPSPLEVLGTEAAGPLG
jgi:hypothetical protein